MPYNGTEFWNAVVAAAVDLLKKLPSAIVLFEAYYIYPSLNNLFYFFCILYHKLNVLNQQLVAAASHHLSLN